MKEASHHNINKAIHIVSGLGDGGAEAALYRMVISNTDEESTVISLSNKSKYGKLLEEKGVTVHALELSFNLYIFFKLYKLYKILRRIQPDVIQTWMYHADLVGGVIGRLSGIKNIIWGVYCTNFVLGETKILTILVIFINSILSRFIPKKIIFCAEEGLRVHKKYGFSRKKLIYIPNGLPHETFTIDTQLNTSLRKENNIKDSDIILGIVGRYSPMKDHLNFIKALGLMLKMKINFTAIFIGENLDIQNHTLVSQIKRYGLEEKVRLLGPRQDIPQLMNLMDLNILSSSFGEGQPTVLCESMLSGTPCISTDIGDSAVIVGDYGWIVPPSDPQKLSDQILKALETMKDEVKWNERVLGGREHIITKFTIEAMHESYLKVWKEKYQ